MSDTPELTLSDMAAALMKAESDALIAIKTQLDAFDAALNDIDASLDLPLGYKSDAKRIISELRTGYSYRRLNDIPAMIVALNPSMATVSPSTTLSPTA